MTALVLSQSEVRRLLPMRVCMDLMADVLRTLGRGDAANPLRWAMRLPGGKGILGMMPGCTGTPDALGLKVVTVFPGNHGTEYDAHQGVVMLFDTERGLPTAILDGSEVTAIRTAAVSGVATELLAREDAKHLAILGSGVQARTHLDAMLRARAVETVRVYSPTVKNREAFANRESERHDIRVEAVDTAQAAVEGADIVCTTTSSKVPVVHGDWIAAGAHVNAAGASVKTARELDTVAVVRARLFVDRRESTVNESGDYLFPLEEGAIGEDHIVGELGEILLGRIVGRRGGDEVTLFKSLGLAVEDLAAAHFVHARALEEGVGTPVDLGGLKE